MKACNNSEPLISCVMALGGPVVKMVLSAEEAAKLATMARRPRSNQRSALRAGIGLDCASEMGTTRVAEGHGVTVAIGGKWRQLFVTHRLAVLGDSPRPGQPRQITKTSIEGVVTRTLEKSPVGATHWSTHSIAEASGLTQNAIVRIWWAFGLKPQLQLSFELQSDPCFVKKVRDLVGLDLNPPEQTRAVVLWCASTRRVRSRHWTDPPHHHQEFLCFLQQSDVMVSAEFAVHLVRDSFGTHKGSRAADWLRRRPDIISNSPRREVRGSTRSSAGSPKSPSSFYTAVPSARSTNCIKPFASISKPTATIRRRPSGRLPPTSSPERWRHFGHDSIAQDTSGR
jgi:hypothetical protein